MIWLLKRWDKIIISEKDRMLPLRQGSVFALSGWVQVSGRLVHKWGLDWTGNGSTDFKVSSTIIGKNAHVCQGEEEAEPKKDKSKHLYMHTSI